MKIAYVAPFLTLAGAVKQTGRQTGESEKVDSLPIDRSNNFLYMVTPSYFGEKFLRSIEPTCKEAVNDSGEQSEQTQESDSPVSLPSHIEKGVKRYREAVVSAYDNLFYETYRSKNKFGMTSFYWSIYLGESSRVNALIKDVFSRGLQLEQKIELLLPESKHFGLTGLAHACLVGGGNFHRVNNVVRTYIRTIMDEASKVDSDKHELREKIVAHLRKTVKTGRLDMGILGMRLEFGKNVLFGAKRQAAYVFFREILVSEKLNAFEKVEILSAFFDRLALLVILSLVAVNVGKILEKSIRTKADLQRLQRLHDQPYPRLPHGTNLSLVHTDKAYNQDNRKALQCIITLNEISFDQSYQHQPIAVKSSRLTDAGEDKYFLFSRGAIQQQLTEAGGMRPHPHLDRAWVPAIDMLEQIFEIDEDQLIRLNQH